jgi:uncharacterized protein YrrD
LNFGSWSVQDFLKVVSAILEFVRIYQYICHHHHHHLFACQESITGSKKIKTIVPYNIQNNKTYKHIEYKTILNKKSEILKIIHVLYF